MFSSPLRGPTRGSAALLIAVAGAVATGSEPSHAHHTSAGETCGIASWYGGRFAGRLTASGERMDPQAMTTAHRSLPFGTRLRVTYEGRSVVVRVNDRGPASRRRVLDLTEGAAERLGYRSRGIARVCYTVLGPSD